MAGADGTQPNQLVSGADMKNIWFNYNATTDTMYVGVQGFTNSAGQSEILGDITGNPNAAARRPELPIPAGPISSATNTWLGLKSIAIAGLRAGDHPRECRRPDDDGDAVDHRRHPRAQADATATPDFQVAQYTASTPGSGNQPQLLPNSFGTAIANGGGLAFNTTAAHPDFEFTINNFQQDFRHQPRWPTGLPDLYIEGF